MRRTRLCLDSALGSPSRWPGKGQGLTKGAAPLQPTCCIPQEGGHIPSALIFRTGLKTLAPQSRPCPTPPGTQGPEDIWRARLS